MCGNNDVIKMVGWAVVFFIVHLFFSRRQTDDITAALRLIRVKEKKWENMCRGQKRVGRGGEKREERQREEKMSGTLPACRSNMKNDVCSCSNRQARMDTVLHQRHSITFPTDT